MRAIESGVNQSMPERESAREDNLCQRSRRQSVREEREERERVDPRATCESPRERREKREERERGERGNSKCAHLDLNEPVTKEQIITNLP